MDHVINLFENFERWFNHHFGWFFINGRKQNEKLKV